MSKDDVLRGAFEIKVGSALDKEDATMASAWKSWSVFLVALLLLLRTGECVTHLYICI